MNRRTFLQRIGGLIAGATLGLSIIKPDAAMALIEEPAGLISHLEGIWWFDNSSNTMRQRVEGEWVVVDYRPTIR